VGGVGCETRKCTVSRPSFTGTSQCDFDDSRRTFRISGEYQSLGAAVAGSSGSIAFGMSFQRKFWKVRALRVSIGYLDSTSMPYWPSNRPNPCASLPVLVLPLRSRSNPVRTPVLDGAMKAYG
jgi:hypothetical protein